MKKTMYLLVFIMILSVSTFAQSKSVKIKAYGSCGMCEKRIEKAAITVDGVTKAEWNKEAQTLELSFDTAKTNINKISHAVAAAGHDTDSVRANDKIYNALPGCCKYKRPEKKKLEKKHRHGSN
jgi:copper chaperone CopZ